MTVLCHQHTWIIFVKSNTGKIIHKGMKEPLHCIQVTSPYTSHVVEVTLRSHYSAYDLFSNTTWLSFGLFNSGENNVTF